MLREAERAVLEVLTEFEHKSGLRVVRIDLRALYVVGAPRQIEGVMIEVNL